MENVKGKYVFTIYDLRFTIITTMKRRHWFMLVLVLLCGWNELFKLAFLGVTQGGYDYFRLVNCDGGILFRWIGSFALTAWLMDRAGLLRGPSSS
jgi:hypothetical protein